MSNKYPCVYYDNGKCQKFSDKQYNAWCDFDNCESRTPSNGDHIRAMSDDELAVLFDAFCDSAECRAENGAVCPFYQNCPHDGPLENNWKIWLKQPYTE